MGGVQSERDPSEEEDFVGEAQDVRARRTVRRAAWRTPYERDPIAEAALRLMLPTYGSSMPPSMGARNQLLPYLHAREGGLSSSGWTWRDAMLVTVDPDGNVAECDAVRQGASVARLPGPRPLLWGTPRVLAGTQRLLN